jgi:transcriptional regulator with XRE-family HTH domain
VQKLHFFGCEKMTGYELRLWRKGLGWSQDKAAEELGVSLRTYKVYEKSEQVSRLVTLAIAALSVNDMLPTFLNRKTNKDKALAILQATISDKALGRTRPNFLALNESEQTSAPVVSL